MQYLQHVYVVRANIPYIRDVRKILKMFVDIITSEWCLLVKHKTNSLPYHLRGKGFDLSAFIISHVESDRREELVFPLKSGSRNIKLLSKEK